MLSQTLFVYIFDLYGIISNAKRAENFQKRIILLFTTNTHLKFEKKHGNCAHDRSFLAVFILYFK